MIISPVFTFLLYVLLVIGIVFAITAYIFYLKSKNLSLKIQKKNLCSNLREQLETCNGLLMLIDNQIQNEIVYTLRAEYSLNEQYNPINIDKDCRAIAEAVYNSIDPVLFINLSSVNGIYTNEFWMNYITKKTTCVMLASYLKTMPGES